MTAVLRALAPDERGLEKQLRKLFDKTTAAFSCSELDYRDRVNLALVEVYAFGKRRANENAKDAERYRARRMEVFKTRCRIEMPQGKNWKPTTLEDFNAEYDAECDKEIVKQRAARNEEDQS